MKFGFDIDDTLINLREHAFHIYNQKLKQNIGLDVFHALTTMEIHSAFGFDERRRRQAVASLRDDIYYSHCASFPHAVKSCTN